MLFCVLCAVNVDLCNSGATVWPLVDLSGPMGERWTGQNMLNVVFSFNIFSEVYTIMLDSKIVLLYGPLAM